MPGIGTQFHSVWRLVTLNMLHIIWRLKRPNLIDRSVFYCQVILLSATMPADVLEVTKRFMREPIRILVKKEELTLEGIRQFYIEVEQEVRITCIDIE